MIIYSVTQDGENSINFAFKIPEGYKSSDIQHSFTKNSIRVTVDDQLAIYGTFYRDIDDDVTTDIIEEEELVRIYIQKKEPGLWPGVIVDRLEGRIDAYSETLLGRHFEEQKDYGFALQHYRSAGELGSSKAYLRIGDLYSSEASVCQAWSIQQDLSKAVDCYGKAASLNDKEGFYRLGLATAKGKGVPRDSGLAIELLSKAHEAGHVEAANLIGQLHLDDEPDYDAAVTWLTLAASKGSAAACHTLGKLYWTGEEGLDIDLEAAIEFCEKAHRLDPSYEVPVGLINAMKKQDPDFVAQDEVEEVTVNKVALAGLISVIGILAYFLFRKLKRD